MINPGVSQLIHFLPFKKKYNKINIWIGQSSWYPQKGNFRQNKCLLVGPGAFIEEAKGPDCVLLASLYFFIFFFSTMKESNKINIKIKIDQNMMARTVLEGLLCLNEGIDEEPWP